MGEGHRVGFRMGQCWWDQCPGHVDSPTLSLDFHDSSAGYGDCCAHFADYETEAQLVSVL